MIHVLLQRYTNITSLFASGLKKKKKHKKKSKRRRESVSSKSSDSGQPRIKMEKLDDNLGIENDKSKLFDIVSRKDSMEVTKLEDQFLNKDVTDKIVDGNSSPLLPPISKKLEDESDEPIIPKVLGLYFSVFE